LSRRIVAINAGWLVSDRVFRLSINFGVGILIARHLGPDQFGVLSLGQMLVTLLLPLATFGLPEILVREFSKAERSPAVVLTTALRLRFALAFVSLGVMMAVAFALRGKDATTLLVVLAYGLSFIPQALDAIESRFQSLNRVGVISTIRIVVTIVFGAIKVIALISRMRAEVFALLYTLEIATVSILSFIQCKRYDVEVEWSAWDRSEAKFLIHASFPLMLRLVTISIYMRVDQFVIASMLGDKSLGIYSVATRIAELWYFIPTSIILAAMPSLTRQHQASEQDYERSISKILRLMILLSVPAAVFISATSGFIVHLLFGHAYAAAAPALAIQAWAGVFVAIGVGANPWFINTGHIRYGLYQAVAGAVVGTGLNLLLVPRFGLIGASISMVASYAVSAILLNAAFARTRPLFWMQLRALILR
jgi:PST family polysaccharide transporter